MLHLSNSPQLQPASQAERRRMKKMELFLLPLPAAGHLTSMLEMASRLIGHRPDISVTVLLMTTPIPGAAFDPGPSIQSAAASGLDIQFEELGPVQLPPCDGLPSPPYSLFISLHKPHVKAAISRRLHSTAAAAALIIDLLATSVIDVAHELAVPTYLYFTSGASFLSLMLHTPTLHGMIGLPLDIEEARDDQVIEVPGMSPTPLLSVPTMMTTHMAEACAWFLYHCRRFRETKALIVNTFTELEPSVQKAISDGRCVPDHPTPPVYPVGPIIALGGADEAGAERHECVTWLDGQPPASVVFLCFGSRGSFDGRQVKEMAAALEKCGHRFLWSLRTPSAPAGKLSTPVEANLAEVLPEGFGERTKERGLVWPSSVPQLEILSHAAVGGFVTHCGWNSVLESLWFGVPMLAWPLYAEQHFNAYHLARDSGLVVELRVDHRNGNFVSAAEFERGLRCLMGDSKEGEKVRLRAQEMKLASRKAVEEAGSSFTALDRLASELGKRSA